MPESASHLHFPVSWGPGRYRTGGLTWHASPWRSSSVASDPGPLLSALLSKSARDSEPWALLGPPPGGRRSTAAQ